MMDNNKAFIPAYLNNQVVQNLFTIVVQQFVEAESVSTKDQITINYRGPMSELSYDLFGKYVQGEVSIQFVNEFSKQKTEAVISKDIEIFMKLRELLIKNNLMRDINSNEPLDNMHENDFVTVNCEIMNNPIFEYAQNIINRLDMKNTFFKGGENNSDIQGIEILNKLKGHVDEWKNSGTMNFLTNEICMPKARCIVPIEYKNAVGNLNFITHGHVNILGKITNIIDGNNVSYTDILGGSMLDYIFQDYFRTFISEFLNLSPIAQNDIFFPSKDKKIIEIMPIAIFF